MTATPRDQVVGEPSPGLGGQSRWTDIDGPVHYLDFGGPAQGPMIICVHGLGGSAVNWCAIAPLLTGKYRVLAPDLAGHGLTRSAGRGTDVASNRTLLHGFVRAVSRSPVILMGNSMGGMISLLEASADPANVAGLILIDPALPFVPSRPDPFVAALFALTATPVIGRFLIRQRRMLPVESIVSRTLALCCADVSRLPADLVERHVEVARQRAALAGDGRDFADAARSVVETAGYVRGQAYRRGIWKITCPVLLIHGERDRLVPVTAARTAARIHPAWSVVVLPDVGHVPQLEAPRETASAISSWLQTAGKPASNAATPAAS